jgi:hypothetical protein
MDKDLYIEDIFKGILTGIFASYLIILGMRPAAIYPDNILDIIDNPWIFLILFIINYYVFFWDITIGLLLFLTLIALILDIIIFTDGDFIKDNMNLLNTTFYSTNNASKNIEEYESNSDITTNTTISSYRDINDSILEKLIYYKKLYEDTDRIKSYNFFL